MKPIVRSKALVVVAALVWAALACGTVLAQEPKPTPPTDSPRQGPTLPNPVLSMKGYEAYEAGGKQFIRYRYAVENYAAYPDEMFAPAPDLPPCGTNKESSRTWVEIYQQDGKRLYGFCALGKSAGLNDLWFPLEPDALPPSWVYIELTDRKTNTKYKSNLAETTQ
ncbi:MAG TPA: hypothetical protein VN256_09290 [Pyrinomonadaceae bacterium]|nr:hypothetical protein [Pyrinomonadaceae bacterium]